MKAGGRRRSGEVLARDRSCRNEIRTWVRRRRVDDQAAGVFTGVGKLRWWTIGAGGREAFEGGEAEVGGEVGKEPVPDGGVPGR